MRVLRRHTLLRMPAITYTAIWPHNTHISMRSKCCNFYVSEYAYIKLGHNEVLASNTLQHVTHITATRLLCEPFQYQAITCEHTYTNAGVQTQAQI